MIKVEASLSIRIVVPGSLGPMAKQVLDVSEVRDVPSYESAWRVARAMEQRYFNTASEKTTNE